MAEPAAPTDRSRNALHGLAPIAVLIMLLALLPLVASLLGNPFLIKVGTRILVFALAAIALNLVLGFGGLVSLLHAGLFGIGGYVVGILAFHADAGEPLLGFIPGSTELAIVLPLAMLISALAAAAMGIVSLRTGGAYFIMITLAFNQMLYYFFVALQAYGGEDGLQINGAMTLFGLPTGGRIPFYFGCLAALVLALLILQRLIGSRFGVVLRASAQNERRLSAIGIPRLRYQLVAFAISGAIAGLGGALLAAGQGFISPSEMSWVRSGDLVVMCVLGGMATVWGPVLGAAVFLVLEIVLSGWSAHWQLVFGLIIIAIVVSLRGGLVDLLKLVVPEVVATAPILQVTGLVKRFGGLVATDHLDLHVATGETLALIGPNGAGKTSLIAQLQGDLSPDAGRIEFDGRDITREPPHRRALAGLARSFQITSVFPAFSLRDNVAVAVQARLGHSFRFWRDAQADRALTAPARDMLDAVGLPQTDRLAGDVSHGERRQLELAMALAMQPKLLLLDEPMAGMGREDSATMTRLLQGLKTRYSILLVEHDMPVVFALADRVAVLVAGKTIAVGSADEVRADPAVRAAYLGRK